MHFLLGSSYFLFKSVVCGNFNVCVCVCVMNFLPGSSYFSSNQLFVVISTCVYMCVCIAFPAGKLIFSIQISCLS